MHITGDQAPICSDYLPLNFTLLSHKLKAAGFQNHFVGKGHLGYLTEDHLPINRAWDTHVGYFGAHEAYEFGESLEPATHAKDLWHDRLPADDIVDAVWYSTNYYTERAVGLVRNHSLGLPLWLHLAHQATHAPYTAPPPWEWYNSTPPFFPAQTRGKVFGDMIAVLDSGVGNVTSAMQDRGMWDRSLVLISSDNGGVGPGNNFRKRSRSLCVFSRSSKKAAAQL